MQANGRKDAQGTVSKAPDDMDEGELRDHIATLVTENKRLIRANDELYNELQAVKARITKLATG
jgi:regulator of replication initiation timing